MNESSPTTENRPSISIKYLFNHTADLAATKEFYTDLVGLKQTAYELEWGFLCYQCDGFELMFFIGKDHLHPLPDEWTDQPGYEGGKLEATSWGIVVPEEQFGEVVSRMKNAGVKLFKEEPEWRQNSYWGFTVMDPNGVTVEIYTIPKEKPAITTWSQNN